MSFKAAFRGRLGFLSNFTRAVVYYQGRRFDSVEKAYIAAKYSLDKGMQGHIALLDDPKELKRISRSAPYNEYFNKNKVGIMNDFLKQKFDPNINPTLWANMSVLNKEDFVEYNTWYDNFWGDCVCDKCKDVKGENTLGKLLIEIYSSA